MTDDARRSRDDQLIAVLEDDPDASTIRRLIHDGACPFVDGGGPYRKILNAFNDDEQLDVLRLIHDQYSGEYGRYFDDELKELHAPVELSEHDAVEFFVTNSRYDNERLETLFCRLLEQGDFRTARMVYVRSEKPPKLDADTFEQLNTERFFEQLQDQPAVNAAPIMPIFSDTKAVQLLYEVTLTASNDELRTFVSRTDFEAEHYERAAVYAFLAYDQETAEAIIDEVSTPFAVLKRFFALSPLADDQTVLPGLEEDYTLLRGAGDFAERTDLTDEQAAEVYGRLIESLIDQQHPPGFVNVRSESFNRKNTSPIFAARVLDAFRESVGVEPRALDPVYETLIEYERVVPELLRYLIDWRKPSREQAGQLCEREGYERILREKLNSRELRSART